MNSYTTNKLKRVLSLIIDDVNENDLTHLFYKDINSNLSDDAVIEIKIKEIQANIKDLECYSSFELYVIIAKYYKCDNLIDLELFHSILFDKVQNEKNTSK
ncbi:hypothetical protein Abu_2110 [Aliarcobacter butzleri RM4018]|uniref:Uncharacterized protein n=1 Tax=Aliarcobacter butzleri (strain RM4018) TaxID=367737 RepID=A8EWK1_ALIB4|nr:hypothetical protein [Aliarcobacter butzleri]ABV68324.1 hypothetical protein Abu_2110 [Aliarcobacter butzleri RM4018]GGT79613.1 hypothetical protein GCM10007985_15120 [Aliarcobacter butzleri]SNV33847.1 Uncharacterised protein [Aliarcobacter butzleri]